MKRAISFLFLTLVLGLAQAGFAQAQDQVEIRGGQQKRVANGKVRITFISVTEDSRCPINAKCIWAGNAKVKIQVSVRGGETRTFVLNTNGGDRAGTADAYRVQLEDLSPGKQTSRPIRQRDYRVTVSITKLTR
jgi:hypothetical protein